MILKKTIMTVLILNLICAIPAFTQASASQATTSQPTLWAWKCTVETPYFYQNHPDRRVEVVLDLLALDSTRNFHQLRVKTEVYGDQGAVMISNDHGLIDSTPYHKLVIRDIELIPYPPYFMKITVSNPALGISHTITKRVTVK